MVDHYANTTNLTLEQICIFFRPIFHFCLRLEWIAIFSFSHSFQTFSSMYIVHALDWLHLSPEKVYNKNSHTFGEVSSLGVTVTPTVTLCFSLPTLSHFSPGSGSLDCAGQVGLQKPLFQINFASLEKYASHKANQYYNVDTYMNFSLHL